MTNKNHVLKRTFYALFILGFISGTLGCNSKNENKRLETQAENDSADFSLSTLKNEQATPEVAVLQLTAQHDSLQTFTTAAAAIDLHRILDEAEGQFTIFAPTDQAFLEAGIDINREDTYGDNDKLKNIMLQHVVSQHTNSSTWTDEVMYNTLNSRVITIKIDEDEDYVNEAQILKKDLENEGGTVHIINKVLTPNTNN